MTFRSNHETREEQTQGATLRNYLQTWKIIAFLFLTAFFTVTSVRILKEHTVYYNMVAYPVDNEHLEGIKEKLKIRMASTMQTDGFSMKLMTVERTQTFGGRGSLSFKMLVWPSSIVNIGVPIPHTKIMQEYIKPYIDSFIVRDFYDNINSYARQELYSIISGDPRKLSIVSNDAEIFFGDPELQGHLQKFVRETYTIDGPTINLLNQLEKYVFRSGSAQAQKNTLRINSLFGVLAVADQIQKDPNPSVESCSYLTNPKLPKDQASKLDMEFLERLGRYCKIFVTNKVYPEKESPYLDLGSPLDGSASSWIRLGFTSALFAFFITILLSLISAAAKDVRFKSPSSATH